MDLPSLPQPQQTPANESQSPPNELQAPDNESQNPTNEPQQNSPDGPQPPPHGTQQTSHNEPKTSLKDMIQASYNKPPTHNEPQPQTSHDESQNPNQTCNEPQTSPNEHQQASENVPQNRGGLLYPPATYTQLQMFPFMPQVGGGQIYGQTGPAYQLPNFPNIILFPLIEGNVAQYDVTTGIWFSTIPLVGWDHLNIGYGCIEMHRMQYVMRKNHERMAMIMNQACAQMHLTPSMISIDPVGGNKDTAPGMPFLIPLLPPPQLSDESGAQIPQTHPSMTPLDPTVAKLIPGGHPGFRFPIPMPLLNPHQLNDESSHHIPFTPSMISIDPASGKHIPGLPFSMPMLQPVNPTSTE